MTELLTFGMVTILLLTLVSTSTLPLKLWSSNTIAPYSTWEGPNNQLDLGNWKPSGHVTTFNSGVKVEKYDNGQFTDIHSSLNGRILNSTTIPNSYFLLQNNGNLVQTADGRSTPIYNSNTAPLWAPIQWSDGSSKRCVTTSASNLISFDLCNGRSNTQLWKHNSNLQVVNQLTGLCLDGTAGSSARSNTCDTSKASQKWSWVNGYLKLFATGKCLKVNSAIGTCDGPLLAWNK